MVGTFLLVFIGPASVIVASVTPFPYSLEEFTFVALVFGCVVASVIFLLGRFSGAHINPAITVANGFAGSLKRELLLPYVVFQVVGGLLAGLSLKVVFGSFASSADLGSTKLAAGVTPIEGVLIEAVGTFILAFSALSAYSFVRAPVRQALLVGATLFILILFTAPSTGASFNPVRSLGPSVFSGYFGNQLVYWVGPLVGGVCAGLIFGTLRKAHGRPRTLPAVCVC